MPDMIFCRWLRGLIRERCVNDRFAAVHVSIFFAVFLAVAGVLSPAGAAETAPRVAVTVKPIHSLVASVMAGVGEPDVLIGGADSPHTHAIRPSEAKRIESAQLLFWVGPTMESSYVKPIAALARGKVISVLDAPGVTVLPVRPAGDLAEDAATDAEEAPGALDPHIWLDPENARAVVRAVANALAAADPAHADVYAANAAKTDERLVALDTELREKLTPFRDMPFIPYHDAYQYLERRYRLTDAGAVTVSPERAPGARRINELRAVIKARHVRCVFTEPEFEPAIVRTLVAGTGAKIATLDPEGAQLPPGPNFYFNLMRAAADSLRGCLLPSPG